MYKKMIQKPQKNYTKKTYNGTTDEIILDRLDGSATWSVVRLYKKHFVQLMGALLHKHKLCVLSVMSRADFEFSLT